RKNKSTAITFPLTNCTSPYKDVTTLSRFRFSLAEQIVSMVYFLYHELRIRISCIAFIRC
ncbi:MAG: hypothetical protein ACK52X_00375, partial [bacterium]